MPATSVYVRAGTLRHVASIMQQPGAQDAAGQPTDDWNEVKRVRCSIEPSSGQEPFVAQQFLAKLTHKVTIRYTPAAHSWDWLWWTDPATQIVHKFRLLSVTDVENRHRKMVLMAQELNN